MRKHSYPRRLLAGLGRTRDHQSGFNDDERSCDAPARPRSCAALLPTAGQAHGGEYPGETERPPPSRSPHHGGRHTRLELVDDHGGGAKRTLRHRQDTRGNEGHRQGGRSPPNSGLTAGCDGSESERTLRHRQDTRGNEGHRQGGRSPANSGLTAGCDGSESESPAAQGRKKPVDPETARRIEAMSKLQVDDLVKAECPFSRQLCNATVHTLRDSGLLVVRWHEPGTAPDGRSFQPFGDVWADKVQLVYRKEELRMPPAPRQGRDSGSQEVEVDESILPDGLRVGDPCFALGVLVDKEWYKATVLGVRPKSPQVRIEYTATLEGQTAPLILPEPKKTHVPPHFVRRDRPDPDSTAGACESALHSVGLEAMSCSPVAGADLQAAPPQVAGEREAPLSQDTKVMPSQNGDAQAEGDFVIDADLMCSVCSRPDIEHLMLVCEDCKAGFHTFCLTPPLSGIPDDTWYCQPCAAKRSTASATR